MPMTVMIKPTNNITTATGIVKIKNGETAKIGDSPVITNPVTTYFRELFDVVASSVIYIVYFISRRARRDSST